jgi:FkbM family methyltransferase
MLRNRQRIVNHLERSAVGRNVLLVLRQQRFVRQIQAKPRWATYGFWLVGSDFMANGDYEPVESAFLDRALEESACFINVGANLGYYCCMALKHGNAVIAFEPDPANAQFLLRNLRINGGEGLSTVYIAAAGPSAGIVELYGTGMGASLDSEWAHRNAIRGSLVTQLRINDVVNASRLPQQLLVMIDVEGSELSVLMGMTQLLDRDPAPTWIVEISFYAHLAKSERTRQRCLETFSLFFERGYACLALGNSLESVTWADVNLEADKDIPFGGTRNFVFTKSGQ